MSTPKFAETHNLVAFLEKPKESNGFEGIINFLNASSIKYALTVNLIVYESCIQQLWTTAKAMIVNRERQIQALVDKKKVIITEKSVRSDFMLEDAEWTECLTNDVIFEQLTRRKETVKDSSPTEPIPDEATNEEPISTPSCDPPQSGEDRLQLAELMTLCTKLQKQVLDLEEAKTAQAKEIASLKMRVKQLEKRRKSRTSGLKRFKKVGSASRVESSNDVSLGAQEEASKQGRKIDDLDVDAEVTLIDETQERNDEEMFFDVQDYLQGKEVVDEKEVAKKEVSAADLVTTAGEVVTTASSTTTVDKLTLAQTLIEIKAAKLKVVTTTATTTTTTRPKARGVVFQEPSEFKTTSSPLQALQLPQAKDKGKGKMVEPEKPLKKKDQIAIDEELALRLHVKVQAELEKKE
ncbi:hypothetical protein Tco_1407040 [Tanacetum coccineum]